MTASRLLRAALLSLVTSAPVALAQQEQRGEAQLPSSQLTKPPAVQSSVRPEYPEEAKAGGFTGDVGMEITIGADGKVQEVKVIRPAGHGLDEAAVAAVKQFVFSPAEIDGQPAAVTLGYTEHFVLPKAVPDAGSDLGDGGLAPELPLAVKGTVHTRGTRAPIAGATISAVGVGLDPAGANAEATLEVQSDANGHFELHAGPGPLAISVFESNHEKFATSETVKRGERLEVDYFLRPKSFGLFETVVRGEREKKEVTRYTLTRQELETTPGSFGDPIRVLQDFPGVARAPFVLGALLIRGSGPNDTGTYVDGIELPLLFHFVGGPSVINAEFVDKLDFYTGNFGAEYGRAIGGVVDIETRKASPQDVHGSASINLLDSEAYVTTPITKDLAVSAAGRRSYYDLFLPAVYSALNVGISILPAYDDYQLRVDYRIPDTRQRLQLFFFGSDDHLELTQNASSTAVPFSLTSSTSFLRLATKWTYDSSSVKALAQVWIGSNSNDQGGAIGASTNETDTVGGARARLETDLAPSLGLRTGLDVLWTGVYLDQAGQPPPDTYRPLPGQSGQSGQATAADVSSRYLRSDTAGWAELTWRLPWRIKLVPSLRVDAFRLGDHWLGAVDPRLTAIKEFDSLFGLRGATELKAGIGLYHEPAYPNELSPTLGNPNLPLQQALQTSVGIEHAFTDVIHGSITGFFNYETSLAEASTGVTQNPNGSVTPDLFRPTGVIRAYGLELFARHELSRHLYAWLAYTLSFSRLLDPEFQGANAFGFHTSPFDETHVLTLIGQYRFDGGWQIGARFRLTSGLPNTPYDGSTFSPDRQAYTPIFGGYDTGRLPLFQQLDVRIDKEWLFDRWSLGVYLDIQNVYNYVNTEFQAPNYNYTQLQTIQGIPFLPTLGVQGRF